MQVLDYAAERGWRTAHRSRLPGRAGAAFSCAELPLCPATRGLLGQYSDGIYRHQKEALTSWLQGHNTCLATGTASGKSLAFHLCALEALHRAPQNRVLALYPLRALGSEQEERWHRALAGTPAADRVVRIDGGTPVYQRLAMLDRARVLIATPDILHAWLLPRASHPEVQAFLRDLSLVILDEAHTYSGVFGSHAAFLFRRLEHLCGRLESRPRFIAASATMNDPGAHLWNLVGLPFTVIGPDQDSSPKAPTDLVLLDPPEGEDLHLAILDLLRHTVAETEERFITFVDNRKQTEQISSLLARELAPPEAPPPGGGRRAPLQVYPYRAGYEEADRRRIQNRLATGAIRGIVSTSALEMGIDLPHLTLGILVGVPQSATSFTQRIGRIGRSQPGTVLVLNNGSLHSRYLFSQPARLCDLPYEESALYLGNRNIQYIHAQCLARRGGEDDCIDPGAADREETFRPRAQFPPGFVDLCTAERQGEVPPELHSLKESGGEQPNRVFPLRDIDTQYQVSCTFPTGRRKLGSLSERQLLREAYPGAIYYYQTQSYRVVRVDTRRKRVEVRRSKKYLTRPHALPTRITPLVTPFGGLHHTVRCGPLGLCACDLQVKEAVEGFHEVRGGRERQIVYAQEHDDSFEHAGDRFSRHVFTTGVLLQHPELEKEEIGRVMLGRLLREAFLMTVCFERQDVSVGHGRHPSSTPAGAAGTRFLALYDNTYGSLHLTDRFLEAAVLKATCDRALELATLESRYDATEATRAALTALRAALEAPRTEQAFASAPPPPQEDCIEVILPESHGRDCTGEREVFHISTVFKSTRRGLSYYGSHASAQDGPKYVVPVAQIDPIDGESRTGLFDLQRNALVERGRATASP